MAALVARRLGLGRGVAWAAAALFAVHPIHVESVAWIAGRTDILAFLLAAAALAVHLGPRRDLDPPRREPWREPAAVALFALALLAKESAAVVPLWVAALAAASTPRRPLRVLRVAAPYCAVVLLYLAARFLWLGVSVPAAPAAHGLLAALLTLPPTLVRYLAWLAWPAEPRAYVQNPYVTSPLDPRLLGALAALALLGWALQRLTRRRPVATPLALLLALSFAPIANLARLGGPEDMGAPMAERFCYLPSLPFLALAALAGATALELAVRPTARRPLAAALLAALLVAGVARTWARNRDWHDDETLFTRETASTPGAPLLWINLAQARMRAGHAADADAALRRAEALAPESVGALAARAQWLVLKSEPAAALPLQRQVVEKTAGRNAVARSNLAFLLRATGGVEEAEAILEELTVTLPDYPAPHFNLGELRRAAGSLADAARSYRTYLDLMPGDLRALERLASTEAALGHPERAEALYLARLRRSPADARLLNNLGLVRLAAEDLPGAISALESATRVDPDYARARFNLAVALARAGRIDASRELLEELVASAPASEAGRAAAARLESLRGAAPPAVPLAGANDDPERDPE